MGKDVALDRRVFLGSLDLTGSLTEVPIAEERDALDGTTYASGKFREWVKGLGKVDVSYTGFFDENAVPNRNMLGNDEVLTVAANPGAFGAPAFFGVGLHAKWAPDLTIGTLAKVTGSIMGQGKNGLIAGLLVLPKTVVSGSGHTDPVELPAGVSSLERLAASLHSVLITSSPNLTVSVQSDNSSGFGSPTTVGSFTAMTDIGAQLATFAGPITDTWFRLAWTFTGSGSITVAGAVGVNPL